MNGKRMIFGFLAGIATIALAIAAIPFSADAQVGHPTGGTIRASMAAGSGCETRTISLDEGYGLTRTAVVCR